MSTSPWHDGVEAVEAAEGFARFEIGLDFVFVDGAVVCVRERMGITLASLSASATFMTNKPSCMAVSKDLQGRASMMTLNAKRLGVSLRAASDHGNGLAVHHAEVSIVIMYAIHMIMVRDW